MTLLAPKNGLRIVQLNIALGQHEGSWSFLEGARLEYDVVCLQEVLYKDHQRLAQLFGYAHFEPMTRVLVGGLWREVGLGIYTYLPVMSCTAHYYVGTSGKLSNLDVTTLDTIHETENRMLLVVEVEHEGVVYKIGTTHFTWVPAGIPSCHQRQDAHALLEVIRELDDIILFGDFNFPKGSEIYNLFTKELSDCLPPEIDTTLDPVLHKLRGSVLVVSDYVFATATYSVKSVKCVFGVSDHAALLAQVSRN